MLKGQIILWWGSLATIPPGWQHCDGTNGTPDLRFRFIRGAHGEGSVHTTGGSTFHTHPFTGDGHNHTIPVGGGLDTGAFKSSTTDTDWASGITDQGDGRPPYYTLAYIMKMHDDPESQPELPWPYAAKAIVQHEHVAPNLLIWLTFRHKMNMDNKPAHNKWIVELDDVPQGVTTSSWLDPWTMHLIIGGIGAPPARVTVEYDGPDVNLATIWHKQWEPWGPISSFDMA